MRQQFGSTLRGRPHRLHIIRILHSGGDSDKPATASYIARAICAKASLLQSTGEHRPLWAASFCATAGPSESGTNNKEHAGQAAQ